MPLDSGTIYCLFVHLLKERNSGARDLLSPDRGRRSMGTDVPAVDGAGNLCSASILIATGMVRRSPSTRRGNVGGMSVEEGYVDQLGRAVTKHTVYDRQGRVVHGPHFRPGGFR